MSALRPFTGDLRIAYAGRTVVVSRRDGAWHVGTQGSLGRESAATEVIAALAPPRSPQTVIAFEAEGGLVGRIRDGGGPRESYVVDYDAPHENWGAATDTLESALTLLFEELEFEDPPDSGE